jgi:hypothetical protein
MHFFILLFAMGSTILVVAKTPDCDYTSREYQIVLKPEIASGANSFADGISLVLNELEKIENTGLIDFKLTRSSLKIKNITSGKYFIENPDDLQMKITMKSREKKIGEPADFVLKFSNADPSLACVPLKIAKAFTDYVEKKIELDLHVTNGKVMTKSATSYTVDMPTSMKFTQSTVVNLSSIFTNSAQKLTYSGQSIIAQPAGKSIQKTAEFEIRLFGSKFKATVMALEIGEKSKFEFSFRIKGSDVDENVLNTAQDFAKAFSLVPSVALFAGSDAHCSE